jgi:hypothetical protein
LAVLALEVWTLTTLALEALALAVQALVALALEPLVLELPAAASRATWSSCYDAAS